MEVEGLVGQIKQLEASYDELRQAVASGKEQNHGQLGQLRRDIARAKTVLQEKMSSPNS